MKLSHIKIDSYGLWKNKEWDVEGSLLFFGHNESGKSTILEFIEGVLFGFRTIEQEGSSGSLLINSGEDTWYIERRQSRSKRGETTVLKNGRPAAVSGLLQGIDRTTFRHLYRMDLDQLHQMKETDPAELNQQLFDTSLTGITGLFSAQRTSRKKASELFKPRGRATAVNKLVMEMNETKREVEDWKKKLDKYKALKEELLTAEQSLEEMDTEEKKIQLGLKDEELKDLLLPVWKSYEEVRGAELYQPTLTKKTIEAYERNKAELHDIEKKEAVLKADQKTVRSFSFTAKEKIELHHLLESSGKAELYEQQKDEASEEVRQAEKKQEQLQSQFPPDIHLESIVGTPPLRKKLDDLTEEERMLKIEEKQLRGKKLSEKRPKTEENYPGKWFSAVAFTGALGALFLGEWAAGIFLVLFGAALYLYSSRRSKSTASPSREMDALQEYWENFHKQKDKWCEEAELPYGLDTAVCRHALEAAGQYQELSGRLESFYNKKNEADAWLKRFRNEASRAGGLPPEEPVHMHVQAIKQTADHYQQEEQQVKKQREEQEYAGEKLNQLNAEKLQLQKDQQELLESVSCENENQFSSLMYEEEEKRAQKEEAESCIHQMNAVVPDALRQKKLLKELAGGEDKRSALVREAEDVKKQKEELYEKKLYLEQSVRGMEEKGTYTELQQSYNKQKDLLKELAAQWAVYAAEDMIAEKVRTIYEKEKQPDVLQNASRMFSDMTEGKYPRIHIPLEEKKLLAERRDGAVFSPAQLSTGTRELLYCAIRLSLIQVQQALPVFMDDVLVNMDEPRRLNLWRTLRRVNEKHQIIFFTCHEHIAGEWEDFIAAPEVKLSNASDSLSHK
ncbi:MAG: hypothetical protein EA344_07935 [Alkalicoccus sp.]|nr:MAG: hypothetical protein EA344_07935 [Alkalicoccus sp.]